MPFDECLLYDRVVATNAEHAKTRQEIEVALAVAVDEIAAFGALVEAIIIDGLQYADHLLVE